MIGNPTMTDLFGDIISRLGSGTPKYSSGYLPEVSNPDKAMADMTRQDYIQGRQDFDQFEQALVKKAQTDTGLIDQAREDATTSQQLAQGIAERNRQRYGTNLTAVQQQQQDLSNQRGSALGTTNAINNARLVQSDQNRAMLGDLINIGQGLNRSSMDQLGVAAQNDVARKNAYRQAKAANKASTYQAVGSLASTAILALAFGV